MVSRHILNVFVDHMYSYAFRMAVAFNGPGLFITIVTLRNDRRCSYAMVKTLVGNICWYGQEGNV